MAAWMSSSVGFMVTLGTLSSTSTAKKGRSTNRKPEGVRLPSRFFMLLKLLLVAVRMACGVHGICTYGEIQLHSTLSLKSAAEESTIEDRTGMPGCLW